MGEGCLLQTHFVQSATIDGRGWLNDMDESVLHEGEFIRAIRRGHWEYVERVRQIGAVMIIAVTGENRLVLTEQFRIPVDRRVIELPAGLAGDGAGEAGESLEIAARRELLEETGYEAAEMTRLIDTPSTPGLANEIVTLFMAKDLKKVGPGGGDEAEDILVHEIPLDQCAAWLMEKADSGLLVDARVFGGLYFAERETRGA